MFYTVTIPAKFAAEFAAGSVCLMNAGVGLTTPLVSATGGTIVGAATLVPAAGAAAEVAVGGAGAAAGSSSATAAATAGGIALGPVLAIGVGGLAVVGLGVFLWRRSRKAASAAAAAAEEMIKVTIECDEADAEAVLAEVHAIVEAAAARDAA